MNRQGARLEMKKFIYASALIAVIASSAVWTGVKLHGQRSPRPVVGSIHRSKADGAGHMRGIVQVDLMRQIMADKARLATTAPATKAAASHRVPGQDHRLLGRPAPELVLRDTSGKTWNLRKEVRHGPVVVVFYLGSSCMACVTHLTELDMAMSRLRARGVQVLAVSADAPGFTLDRMRKYGEFQVPFLSEADHAVALAYGVWKPVPGGNPDEGEALHGTFIVDREGLIRWASIGNRPYTDIEALLGEVDSMESPSTRRRMATR
jgi:peroxiredoxin